MTTRLKLLSAASAIAMAMAVGGAQAAELLTDETLDTISAGVEGASASAIGAGAAGSQAVLTCGGVCGLTDGVTSVTVGNGTSFFAQALGS